MMSNLIKRKLFTIMAGILLVLSCQSPIPIGLQLTSSATPTIQPTSLVSASTEQSLVSVSGRLLLVVGSTSGDKYLDTDVDLFEQYRWLELPGMTVTPHAFLTGDYPIRDDYVMATFSPDHAHLAFVRDTFSKIEIAGKTYDAETSHSVLLADPEGGDAIPVGQPITEGEVNHVMGCGDGPAWSANSQFFAFARKPDWTSSEKEHHLYIYEVGSGKLNTITIHSQQDLGAFALSPDGTQIATTEIETTPEYGLNIHLRNADGSNDRVLVRGWVSSNIVWHPDGTRIFFKSDRLDNRTEPGIYSVDVATGSTTLLAAVSKHAWCLGLSPDSSLLTYDDLGIMAVSPDGGEPRSFLDACDVRYVGRQVWSPDNQYVAFVGGNIPDTKIFIMDRAGTCKALDYDEDGMIPWDLIGWLLQ